MGKPEPYLIKVIDYDNEKGFVAKTELGIVILSRPVSPINTFDSFAAAQKFVAENGIGEMYGMKYYICTMDDVKDELGKEIDIPYYYIQNQSGHKLAYDYIQHEYHFTSISKKKPRSLGALARGGILLFAMSEIVLCL